MTTQQQMYGVLAMMDNLNHLVAGTLVAHSLVVNPIIMIHYLFMQIHGEVATMENI